MNTLENAKNAILKAGGSWRRIQFQSKGEIVECDALVAEGLSAKESDALLNMAELISFEEGVVAALALDVEPMTFEVAIERLKKGLGQIDRRVNRFWMVFNDSLDCQLYLISELWYLDNNSNAGVQLAECRKLLVELWARSPFKLCKVWREGIFITFKDSSDFGRARQLFDEIVAYQMRFGTNEFSSSKLLRETVRSGGLVL